MVAERNRAIRFLVGCVVLVATGLACTAQGAGKQAFENFVRPALRLLQGDARPDRPRVRARVVGALSGAKDRRHFARVRVTYGEDGYNAREVGPAGSGNLRSMVEANGLAIVHEGRRRVEAGETVEVMLLGAPESETGAV